MKPAARRAAPSAFRCFFWLRCLRVCAHRFFVLVPFEDAVRTDYFEREAPAACAFEPAAQRRGLQACFAQTSDFEPGISARAVFAAVPAAVLPCRREHCARAFASLRGEEHQTPVYPHEANSFCAESYQICQNHTVFYYPPYPHLFFIPFYIKPTY